MNVPPFKVKPNKKRKKDVSIDPADILNRSQYP